MSASESMRLSAVRLRKLAEVPYRLNVAEKALLLDAALDLEAAAVIAQPPLSDDRQRTAFMAGRAAHVSARGWRFKRQYAEENDAHAYTAWLATQPKVTP